MSDTEERLTEYFLRGGLYNPELMQHDKVRELLIDCRDEIARLRLTDEERDAVRFCTTAALPETQKLGGVAGGLCRLHAATLRGLLERLGGQT